MKLTAKKLILIGLILVGAYWCYEAFNIGLWVRKGPGGGFMPLLAGGLCILFSLILLIQDRKEKAGTGFNKVALLPIGALAVIILSSYLIGIALSVVIFIFLWLFLFEKMPLLNSVLVSILWPGALYAIFVLWLQTPLPKGLLGLL